MVTVEAITDDENPRYRVTTSVEREEAADIFRKCFLRGYFLNETLPLMIIISEGESRSTGFARLITSLATREVRVG
jgi:hypothetical protein